MMKLTITQLWSLWCEINSRSNLRMSLKTQMDLNFKNKQSTIASYLTKISQLFIFVFFLSNYINLWCEWDNYLYRRFKKYYFINLLKLIIHPTSPSRTGKFYKIFMDYTILSMRGIVPSKEKLRKKHLCIMGFFSSN